MKKFLSFLAMALVFGFTACDDVPLPYELNTNPSGSGEQGVTDEILSESFASSLGGFKSYTTEGGGAWTIDYSTAKAAGYDNTSKVTTDGTYYLVSPEVDLTAEEAAYVTYEYILRYLKAPANQQLLICESSNFDATNAAQGWTLLNEDHKEGSDWQTFETANINVPAEWLGKKVRVALKYTCSGGNGSTWEVKNFAIKRGTAEGTQTPETPAEYDGNLPISEAFATSLGSFTSYTTAGAGEWYIDYSTAKAAGYDNATKVTTDGTYYLVSSPIHMPAGKQAHIAYDYILRYLVAAENQQVLICEDATFDPANAAQGWTLLNETHTEGSDWQTFAHADLDIPAAWQGKTVRVAFKYTCSGGSGSTWEVKNLLIAEGAASAGGNEGGNTGGDTPVVEPTGENLLGNGDFEVWDGNTPTNWKTASSAGNGVLSQSTDAHSGQYSVCVAEATANKRLGYMEMTLAAGTYTFSIWGKGSNAMLLGYTDIDANGKANSNYTYKQKDGKNDYTQLNAGSWTQGVYTFTLTTDTKLCLVVMNPKNSGSLLLDDASLTSADGKILSVRRR